ncbi:MAG: sigma-E processing peptidase SpoIIGA [Clostridia bacterium]|nr:sigma-E processing peptidase SpoIIGA [Clostridia bacterium]
MKPIVYLDMLFLMNFLMDTLVLFGTAFLIKNSLHIWRIVLSASLSSLYSTVMFFPQISFLFSVAFKCIFLFFAVWIAFPANSLRTLLKNAVMFFATNLIFGGIIFLLIFTTDFGTSAHAFVSNGEIYFDISSKTLIFSIILAYLVIYSISYIKKQNLKILAKQVEITVYFDSSKITLKSLCDTGCTLRDPISNFPALIISQKAAKQLFPKLLLDAIKKNQIPPGFETKLRILPFSTLGNSLKIMYGIIPDKVFIKNQEIKNVIVAISTTDFEKKSGFSGILNPDMLDFENNENSNAQNLRAERSENETEILEF